MKTYHSMGDAIPSLIKEPYHVCVMKEILFSIYNVEQLCVYGEEGTIVVLETEDDSRKAEEQYRFSERIPETQTIITADGETWLKTVYITDDAGSGYIVFQRVPPRIEK